MSAALKLLTSVDRILRLDFSLFLFQKIAEQDGGRYETAVYAAQCSNLKRMLAVCTDWEVIVFFLLSCL